MADAPSRSAWARTSAWDGIAASGCHIGAATTGVIAELVHASGLATLMIGAGEKDRIDAALSAISAPGSPAPRLPAPNRAVSAGGITLVSTGPSQYLLVDERSGSPVPRFAEIAPVPALAGQQGGRAMLRLSGPHVRDLLEKGVMVDLHPAAFPIGAVAATAIAHVPVLLWRQEDVAGAPVFVLTVARSMAGDFWSWLSASAAAFGCAVREREAGR